MAEELNDRSANSGSTGKPRNHGTAWTAEEERRLYDGFATHKDIPTLADRHGRNAGGVRGKLARLGLLDGAGQIVIPKPPFTPTAGTRLAVRSQAPRRNASAIGGDGDTLFLALLARLGPTRRAVAIEVLRGLAAIEAVVGDAAPAGGPDLNRLNTPVEQTSR